LPHIHKVFSDYIFFVTKSGKRERGAMMITQKSIILCKKDLKVYLVMLYKDISKVIFSENSHILFLIVSKKFTTSIESFKRQEVNLFMLEMFKKNKLDYYNMEFASMADI
jgi:hypothetical protein